MFTNDYPDDQKRLDDLVNAALAVRKHSYSPYSRFAVGAAILTVDRKIFTGVNVENASYGLTICAERAAIYAMIGAVGCQSPGVLALAADTPRPVVPCGACLQVLAEFNPALPIISVNLKGDKSFFAVPELMPIPFR